MKSDTANSTKKRNTKKLRIFILLVLLAYACLYSYNIVKSSKSAGQRPQHFSDNLAISQENGHYGYVDEKNKLVIPYQFDQVFPFMDGHAITGMKYGAQMKYRLIDKTGTYQGEFYDQMSELGEHLYRVRNNVDGKQPITSQNFIWKLMDSNGHIIGKRDYTLIDPFVEGKARVCILKECGFIDPQGNEVIALSENFNQNQFQQVADFRDNKYTNYAPDMPHFSENLIVTPKGNLMGYSNAQGQLVIEPKFLQAENFSNGVAIVRTEQGLGVINQQGSFVVQPTPNFTKIENFTENRAVFTQNGYQGVMDNTGKIIVPISAKYQFISKFQQGLARFSVNNLYGYIDTQGKVVIPPEYKQLGNFINGKAGVIKPDNPSQMIFIDMQNRIVGKSSVRMPDE